MILYVSLPHAVKILKLFKQKKHAAGYTFELEELSKSKSFGVPRSLAYADYPYTTTLYALTVTYQKPLRVPNK